MSRDAGVRRGARLETFEVPICLGPVIMGEGATAEEVLEAARELARAARRWFSRRWPTVPLELSAEQGEPYEGLPCFCIQLIARVPAALLHGDSPC